jgi:hypothetical protein
MNSDRDALKEIRTIVQPYMAVNPRHVLSDFFLTCMVGYIGLAICAVVPLFSGYWVISFLIGALATYRGSLFLHELVHLRTRVKGFYWCYQLFYGFMHKLPYFYYSTHKLHHDSRSFATEGDPEYDEWTVAPSRAIIYFVLSTLLGPAFLLFRFGIVSTLILVLTVNWSIHG